MASVSNKSEIAVSHVLRSLIDDGRKAYLFGFGTQAFSLLTEAYAETNALDLEGFRDEFWSKCKPEKVIVSDDA